ncbi:cysteine--1-D-myo-inosityl 2-amino-2-deoxy-alpha-D-glucopyranoside ligase [Aestuariimicrobium sp. T2.26MG-19.2B]|uniref:cysteine--1-D-myo-inosityl 2-amino-2-deoxy-alpha-D-glucopyranoside ligase n=1 Tax=Aestuariimicrobium sp. T2.26MG-19.2B TaxID=3040679 RepID=UPI00247747A1|nr:cysteine--1-D-myo-inosityl 2-amino-2-deoxy-alpha-D-glucopyranoside ligase [Aestuariimicrobium sp. T2.26MG-19.2B]CAI9398597.1 L-cysteine:1D-myo-inositol 2-amino-2-deoxy-alpha-D-glucopyranoside ligase [Aestuariimicrobium sp. T2.26MG-19.2B]
MQAWTRPFVPRVTVETDDAPSRLRVHDTAREELVEVGPVDGTARMYVCGITPYDATHLGHANTYLTFDLMNRVWRDLGLAVNYTQNVTDVDEPLLERAEQTGVRWQDLALDQTDLFRSDMEALRVIPPDHYIGAVESVPSVLGLLESMLPSGAVYQVDDPEHPDWYFDVSTAPGFGSISHLDHDAQLKKFVEMGGDPDREGKRNPLDCLVWRLHRNGEPHWESTALGEGRPGWHIECSAIALGHLGPHFDVQGGGSDLAFPHHEMCAAQARVASGEPLADAFVHSGMVALDGEKMSKSKGNLELVSRLRANGAEPTAIRVALLDHHYRSDWEWTDTQLEASEQRLATWRQAVSRAEGSAPVEALVKGLRTSLRDDLDAPAALVVVDDWARRTLAGEGADDPEQAVAAIDALLGVSLTA